MSEPRTSYTIYCEDGRVIYPPLDELKRVLAARVDQNRAYYKILAIKEEVSKFIKLPDFVVEYNKKCEENTDGKVH